MRDTLDIIGAFEAAGRRAETCVLASVVRVQGSTYRRPGARALFVPGGEIIGLIGGGCLEADLLLKAGEVLDAGQPKLVCYDNTSNDEIIWGLGLGCNGKVDVLLEAVGRDAPGPLDFIARCLRDRVTGVLATVIRSEDPSQLAGRWMVDAIGRISASAIWDERIDLSAPVAEVTAAHKPEIVDTGGMDILIEHLELPVRLLVVGAGPDAVPLVNIADRLGWVIEVFDHREAFARADRFPGARAVSAAPVRDIARLAQLDRRTAVVLMTHHYLNDRELLRGFLESDAGYCGVLGPKARLDRLLDELHEQGYVPPLERLQRLHGPVGLDLGAETPEEIALSILAEIQAFFSRGDGAPLTQKLGPIHE